MARVTRWSLTVALVLAGAFAQGCDCGGDDDDEVGCAGRCADPVCANDPACAGGHEDCANRADDDGDGAVDCADDDCANEPDCAQSEDCTNLEDDDGDGAVDCLDDDCVGDGACLPDEETDCSDGVDEDRDGDTDCQDEDCDGVGFCELGAEATCDDGHDNDGDGDTDCDDADCDPETCAPAPEDCGTPGDEDGDGLADCLDDDCDLVGFCEFGQEATCAGGDDNDGDGLPDCLDPDCDGSGICELGQEATCAGGEDNDGDGLPDCLDPDCDGSGICELGSERSCADLQDNDGDGSTDCVDADCAGALACQADCAVEGCPNGLRCAYSVCILDVPCATNDDCAGDTRCDAGHCVPWELPAGLVANAECRHEPVLGPFDAGLQCSFSEAPAGQAPEFTHVFYTPVVADLDLDDSAATVAPSIVFGQYELQLQRPQDMVLRIIDGRTCALQQSFTDPADRIGFAPVSLGDLDGDGHPEIVANRPLGGLIAFGYDGNGAYTRRWTSAVCDGAGNRVDDDFPAHELCGGGPCIQTDGGVSIHDLDDDGSPEIIFGAAVYDAQGCLLDSTQGLHQYFAGHLPILADPDLDGTIEWVSGDALFEWAGDHFEPDPGFVAQGGDGFAAVADFGDFPGAAGDAPGVAEIAVAGHNELRLQSVGGDILFGPFAPPGLLSNIGPGRFGGGPPTIADFDGDGHLEIGTAGLTAYYVFDLDCDADPVPAGCEERGILWSSATQDTSSGYTGSTVFDFEGDGAAEAVYADECFLRLYDGTTGAVEWSTSRSSGTANELPVVADVDGDFRAELVVALNDTGLITCPDTDPLFPAAAYVGQHGVRVYGDLGNQWVPARPVWNQHAYSVTNVGDDGSIPRTSAWTPAWTVPGLNSYRQNIESHYEPLAALDLTVSCQVTPACGGDDPTVAFACDVCNRGLAGVDAGVALRLYDADPDLPFCDLPTDRALDSGECAPVSCTWHVPPGTFDVTAVVDYANQLLECYDGNNSILLESVGCP